MKTREEGALVSVIIPAHNAATTVAATIRSALQQTHSPLEVIVIDDGSTDGTADVVTRFAREDSRVQLHRQSNAGLAAARNAGIENSKGGYVATLDADDLWHPDKLRRQLSTMERSGAGLVYTWARLIDHSDAMIDLGWSGARFEGRVLGEILLGNFVGCGSVPLMTRSAIETAGYYDASLRAHEDQDLYRRIAENHSFAVVTEHLVGYRQTGAGLSDDAALMIETHAAMLAKADIDHGGLPGRAHRWARSGLTFYLARKDAIKGDWPGVLRLLAKLMMTDPAFLVNATIRATIKRIRARGAGTLGSPIPFEELVPEAQMDLLEDALWRRRAAWIASRLGVGRPRRGK